MADRSNRWLTLGANIGVLIGIMLLVVELAQNREMIRTQTRNDISRQIVDRLMLMGNAGTVCSMSMNSMANAGLGSV